LTCDVNFIPFGQTNENDQIESFLKNYDQIET